MSKVAFYKKDASILELYNWEKRLKLFLPEIELVPLLSAEAKKATTALLWKAPMEKLLLFDKLKGIISLGQGVDHILNKNSINKKIHIVRIVDPYIAKSMSHWVILSVLNYIRDTYGYHNQEKIKLYKPRKEINFLNVKIGIYGIGEIGSVVAKDLNSLGFKVTGWSRKKKYIKGVDCLKGLNGFDNLIKTNDIHVCLLPLTSSTVNIFQDDVFKKMKKGSCFINAGRGEHVIEQDLINNCKSGQISQAILDVYRTEPLTQDHPFWTQDNITLWPHVAAETNPDTAAEQIANAVKCINEDILPPNVVNISLGY